MALPPVEIFCRIIEANYSPEDLKALRAMAEDLKSKVSIGEAEDANKGPYDWGYDGREL